MEIFEEKGMNGGDLVFSEESRDYSSLVKSPNKSIKSDVVNTSISDFSFRCLSLDQIEEFVESANARYGASCLSEMDFNARFNDSLYESNPKKIICDSINFNLLSNDSSDNPDFLRQSSLYLSNSSLSSVGANSFNFLSEKIFEAVVCGFINEKNMLLSNITLIFYNPNSSFSFLDSCEKTFLDTSSFNFLPISIDQSVKPESFSCFSLANVSLFQANCLVLDSIQALTNPDQFISGDSFIFSLTSEGMDSVIDTIFDLSPDYVNKRKDGEISRSYVLENLDKKKTKNLIGFVVMDKINENYLVVFYSECENKTADVDSFEMAEFSSEIFEMINECDVRVYNLFDFFVDGKGEIPIFFDEFLKDCLEFLGEGISKHYSSPINLSSSSRDSNSVCRPFMVSNNSLLYSSLNSLSSLSDISDSSRDFLINSSLETSFNVSENALLAIADQFMKSALSISDLSSFGKDSVIVPIFNLQGNPLYYLYTKKVFKSYGLARVTDSYSRVKNGEVVYFLDEDNRSVRVLGIDKLNYGRVNNSARIDIGIEIPANEPEGQKSARIIFTSRLRE